MIIISGIDLQKMKGLIRKRSTTAARLQRAFSAKTLRSSSATDMTDSPSAGSVSAASTPVATPVKSPVIAGGGGGSGVATAGLGTGAASNGGLIGGGGNISNGGGGGGGGGGGSGEKRQFIMETPVQFINVSFSHLIKFATPFVWLLIYTSLNGMGIFVYRASRHLQTEYDLI